MGFITQVTNICHQSDIRLDRFYLDIQLIIIHKNSNSSTVKIEK